ncbi:xanthine dehydrogenase accessory protein XdhC [Massilia sp. Mn16-1_5]|uniref:xanthine dehydrogenase accessory protein XdhC n=1 Tax=Massilia sp. Mn16-1_5 TaxID=2079199 RepID=UPI00109EA8E6|nr:xanthine dehydrogenase accessory protein XdhC [Massilia sp. Mn16-1_5]THC43976.1 xanthine dehydrogenase accessory protein XdhC [Massilia sp. Mn16-1_5]
MDDWLTAARHTTSAPAVLVTVAIVEGSVPREPGAKMLVTAAGFAGTIGGGHLEHRAIEIARRMLEEGGQPRLERFALGPSLGQCCGGIAHLVFEPVDRDQIALLDARRHLDSIRVLALDAPAWALFDGAGRQLAGAAVPAFDRTGGTHVFTDADGRRWLADAVLAPRAHLMLFGAGHVGAAIVRALAELPCRVTWVDEREDLFPATVPANVTIEATDIPEALVEQAAPGTTFLVMTHSHALDLRLSIAILSRPQSTQLRDWFGLIGSDTKRRQFEHRLRERGIANERIDAMVCPIGLPGIAGKAPAVIAASCAAQLLTVWEAFDAASHPEVSPESN